MRRLISVLAAVGLLMPAMVTAPAAPALAACGWKTFPLPVFRSAMYPAGIVSLAALSGNDVWAAGFWTNPLSGQRAGLILRWNGTAWRVVPFPGSGKPVPYSIAATRNDAWAVGQNAPHALVMHWTGARWVLVPNAAPSASSLQSVAMVSPHDVWAIRSDLVVHWNGAHWSRAVGPNFGPDGDYIGVTRIPGTPAVWIYGIDHSSGGSGISAARWTGSSWQKFSLPVQASTTLSSRGIAAASASNAWIGLAADNGAGTSRTVMLHWNGSVWSRVSTPNPGGNGQINGVAAVSASNAWAVGTYLTSGTRLHSFVLHWNGSSWSIVPAPSHTHRVRLGMMGYMSIPGASDVAPVPGTAAVWAAGGTLDEYRC